MKITTELRDAVASAATKYNVPMATLMAVVEVESAGQLYANVAGVQEPVIRWEGHYFDKRLTGDDRARARALRLASPTPGKVKNPAKQADRWARLVNPACGINEEAAFESISWGVGQVMGTHWKVLGFSSASDLAAHARSGVAGQVDLMLRYCEKFKLLDELQRGDFAGFARGYNGPAFRKNKYDTKMKAAAARYANPLDPQATASKPQRAENASTMLKQGAEGARVRVAQSLLKRAGYTTEVDGDFGPATKKAVRAFQKDHGLEQDGIIGPETWRCLEDFRVTPKERPGVPGPAEAVVCTPEGRQGGSTAGGGMILTSTTAGVRAAVDDATAQVGMVAGSGGFVDYLYTGLIVLGVLLMIGGAAWALYGWWRANQTRGDEGEEFA